MPASRTRLETPAQHDDGALHSLCLENDGSRFQEAEQPDCRDASQLDARDSCVQAVPFFDDGTCRYTPDGVTLVRCMGDPMEYRVLPTCRSIDAKAFAFCRSLERIEFPEGLESIGDEAFYACNALRQADLPNSVKSIGDQAFFCTMVEHTRIPAGLVHLGNAALVPMTKLQRHRRGGRGKARVKAADSVCAHMGIEGQRCDGSQQTAGSAMRFHALDLEFSVEGDNPRFCIVDDFLCEVLADGSMRAVFYAGDAREVTVPAGVTHVCDYALLGAWNTRVLNLPASVRGIGGRGLALAKPLECLRVEMPDGRTMLVYPEPGTKGMNACNRAFRYGEIDAALLAKECDVSLERAKPGFERTRRMALRLENGVLLEGARRKKFLDALRNGLDDTLRQCARGAQLDVLHTLVRIGVIGKADIPHAIDIVLAEKGLAACRVLMEESQCLHGRQSGGELR